MMDPASYAAMCSNPYFMYQYYPYMLAAAAAAATGGAQGHGAEGSASSLSPIAAANAAVGKGDAVDPNLMLAYMQAAAAAAANPMGGGAGDSGSDTLPFLGLSTTGGEGGKGPEGPSAGGAPSVLTAFPSFSFGTGLFGLGTPGAANYLSTPMAAALADIHSPSAFAGSGGLLSPPAGHAASAAGLLHSLSPRGAAHDTGTAV